MEQSKESGGTGNGWPQLPFTGVTIIWEQGLPPPAKKPRQAEGPKVGRCGLGMREPLNAKTSVGEENHDGALVYPVHSWKETQVHRDESVVAHLLTKVVWTFSKYFSTKGNVLRMPQVGSWAHTWDRLNVSRRKNSEWKGWLGMRWAKQAGLGQVCSLWTNQKRIQRESSVLKGWFLEEGSHH